MKRSVFFLLLLLPFTALPRIDVFPQGGVESYLGANHYFSLTAWSAVRLSIRPEISVIFKCFQTHLQYQYESFDETSEQFVTRTTKNILSNGTAVIYYQKNKWTLFQAASIVSGKNRYFAAVANSGCSFQAWNWLELEAGLYFLNESSTLWYPEEEPRRIALYSGSCGLKIKFNHWLSLRGRFHYYRNSEKASAYSYNGGLELSPRHPFSFTLLYSRYSESSVYRFAGSFFSIGVNLYY